MQTVNVTDIKVKEGIVKSGPKAGDPWELIIIIGDDGSEFTTFDKKAKEVGIGGVIELEPVIKAGKTNFTKFNIIKKGQAVAPLEASGAETPEKRKSIEDQTRAYIIADLYKAEKLQSSSSQVVSLFAYLDKLGSPPSNQKDEPPAPAKGEDWPPLKDLGQLFTRAQKYGLSSRDVCESVNVGKPEEIIDLDEAWIATAKRFDSAIKAAGEVKGKDE